MGNELCGKKVGFVGFGAVGKHAAKILEAYGCEISFYDPFVDFVKDSYKKCELEEIFKNSDIVSIHLPVLDSTKGMINADLFAKMKETAIFVNTIRRSAEQSWMFWKLNLRQRKHWRSQDWTMYF